ncbi:hypothetical protein Q8F55_004344 [Vanrija albida]|uniref:DUF726-domain-containing protein n=1 Tax=Vanrija albida TaxID=181172 RepID=A0ABR3Q6H3_9TREE
MLPAPRRPGAAPQVAPPSSSQWADLDDDDGWQDMPVVRSDDFTSEFDAIDDKKYHFKPPARLDPEDEPGTTTTSNATGQHLEVEGDTLITDSWRQKNQLDESDYTRLRLDEDEESEEVHMRTRYLFDEDKAMTPLSQMQATKELLTDAQRIAYVGLCHLIARRMLRDMGRGWEGTKVKLSLSKGKGRAGDVPVVESGNLWMIKIMARLYQHMDLERDEQRMIESLGEHGVDPADLTPALMTTHTVKNPEFDPEAKRLADVAAADKAEKEAEAEKEREAKAEEALFSEENDDPAPPYEEAIATPPHETALPARTSSLPPSSPTKSASPVKASSPARSPSARKLASSPTRPLPSPFDFDEGDGDIGAPSSKPSPPLPSFDDDDDGDIGGSSARRPSAPVESPQDIGDAQPEPQLTPRLEHTPRLEQGPSLPSDPEQTPKHANPTLPEARDNLEQELEPMPALPGVSTSLTSADEMVTLDIRWTVLCDLFLVLIADSVYDSRSRTFLERVANALGFGWLDVVRFENRVTDALEIQESVGQLQQEEVIDSRRKAGKKKRYAIMGAAALGGGLVIGLSAGLLAPIIGAGLAGALGTIGIAGTGTFLAGAGGAAVITTTGVLTGVNIAGRGMAKRTREVRIFELKPLHNNKRVSCYLTVGGFMNNKNDDVRLPFSVLDSNVGDVFSALWEPDMLSETGNAIKLLSTEVLTQVGQQVLAATIMSGLMAALQWPMLLTKLGYLIDNPWSNALDRAKSAGLVLADVLLNRHAGVRPTSLVGFSLGARVIFYALLELARVKAYGIVEDVYIFGATVTATRQQWLDVKSVVSGRFVNAFASNDWILGYLFRAASGFQHVAGLHPVETVQGIENVDVTDLIQGHMSYRSSMPLLLKRVGFPVTAEFFDEPDDPELDPEVNERYIVMDEDEEEEMRKKQKKILGIFPRKKGSKPGSVGSTPRASTSTNPEPKTSTDDNDDELPPREETATPPRLEQEEADLGERHPATTRSSMSQDEAAVHIPKTAGFDFAAIAKELGKDIDVDKLKDPSRDPNNHATSPGLTPPAHPERTGSAPPASLPSPRPSSDDPLPPPARSQSALVGLPVDDDGDIAITAQKALALETTPSWDRPAPPPVDVSAWSAPPQTHKAPSVFGFNAWSTPAAPPTGSFSSSGMRAAPPARPHPAELMSNPFADSGNGGGGGLPPLGRTGSWGKKDDDKMALENPW